MSQNTRIQNKWQGYFMEDMLCENCLFYKGKSRFRKYGCENGECCCADEKRDAIANGRIKRQRRLEE
ncbi:hypothetical protein FACS1894171_2210 [Clostridia bacterium]|nr:hypothetical protein FACS1894171_2210 [Clostridia bacterium]